MDSLERQIASLYKAEAPKISAVLTRLLGTHNFDLVEDVLQETFAKAFQVWLHKSPENLAAWLMQTAKNQAIDVIRRRKTSTHFAEDLRYQLESDWTLNAVVSRAFERGNIRDDQLRMMFVCCHQDIRPENRIPFLLRHLCGLSIAAISRAMILPVESVKKRLLRSKEKFKTLTFELPAAEELQAALDSVHTILYLLFNEGFHSSDARQPINLMFCQEAIGLVNLLLDEPRLVNQDTFGLMALMHFHIARVDSRLDASGVNVPIDKQNRVLWDRRYIDTANRFLSIAEQVQKGPSGRFYIEAKIAAQHCNCSAFEQTDWQAIVALYELLIQATDSPIAKLNQAIAIGYTGKLCHAIEMVESLQMHKVLKHSHMPSAILAHLHAKAGDKTQAYKLADESKQKGGTPAEHQVLMQQLACLLAQR